MKPKRSRTAAAARPSRLRVVMAPEEETAVRLTPTVHAEAASPLHVPGGHAWSHGDRGVRPRSQSAVRDDGCAQLCTSALWAKGAGCARLAGVRRRVGERARRAGPERGGAAAWRAHGHVPGGRRRLGQRRQRWRRRQRGRRRAERGGVAARPGGEARRQAPRPGVVGAGQPRPIPSKGELPAALRADCGVPGGQGVGRDVPGRGVTRGCRGGWRGSRVSRGVHHRSSSRRCGRRTVSPGC